MGHGKRENLGERTGQRKKGETGGERDEVEEEEEEGKKTPTKQRRDGF